MQPSLSRPPSQHPLAMRWRQQPSQGAGSTCQVRLALWHARPQQSPEEGSSQSDVAPYASSSPQTNRPLPSFVTSPSCGPLGVGAPNESITIAMSRSSIDTS